MSSSNPPSAATSNTIGSGAANALALLLREDPLLIQHGLTSFRGKGNSEGSGDDRDDSQHEDDAAYSYAAALLHDDGSNAQNSGWMSSSGEYRQRATEALAEVDRKLALVESLAQRVSRDAPEMVAGPLLRLHGFDLSEQTSSSEEGSSSSAPLTTLAATRDKADRLRRQSEVMDTVARRVESTLQRGVARMESATTRLSRVLDLSATLKMILRLQFEARKVHGSGLDLESMRIGNGTGLVDLRDLTRAAASVAAMEQLLSHPSLTPPSGSDTIDVVEKLRPQAEAVAASVRRAAAGLMNELQHAHSASSTAEALTRLGATLQVYFHLGELPDASWKAVSSALASSEKASSQLFHPSAVQKMKEEAQSEAKALAEAESQKYSKDGVDDASASSASSSLDPRQRKKQTEVTYERLYRRKLREKRAAAASKWATGVSDAASRVWNLHRVLARRNDPVTRKNFLEVVAQSDVPSELKGAQERLLSGQSRSSGKGPSSNGEHAEDFDEEKATMDRANLSLFSLFWVQMCIGIGGRIQRLLRYDNGSLEGDVAALYPAVRSAALGMVTELYDLMQMGSSSSDDTSVGFSTTGVGWGAPGIMGGSSGLEDSVFLGRVGGGAESGSMDHHLSRADEAAGGFFGASADAWTHVASQFGVDGDAARSSGTRAAGTSLGTSSSTLAVFSSAEWISLQGGKNSDKFGIINDGTPMGLLPLQTSFLKESKKRLFAPLEFMFPEAVSVDEDGIALPVLPTLPSRYDLAKLDANIREELSLADPRQGGGDLSMITMISDTVVGMLREFCRSAKRAISEKGEDRVLDPRNGSASESTKHNLKVAGVMSLLASFVRNAPENTFVTPYRPAQSAQHEEAAHSCQIALLPALQEIENLVKSSILNPLCRALNRQVSAAISKMHRGTYLQDSMESSSQTGSFVQIHLTDQYDAIASNFLSQLPNEYASIVASTIATFSIYTFVSNAALVRPLGEVSRLRLTQDLADFELSLEQLVFKGGTSMSLSQIAGGKPYAELRALRQILFWNMLDDNNLSPAEVAKSLLREAWVKDVRPSTLFHFLFSFAPALMSSPHHFKRMDAGEYVETLVKLDGSIDDGEGNAWVTTMACCDAYQQRESVEGHVIDGDRRIGAILMILGPELLRRRRQ